MAKNLRWGVIGSTGIARRRTIPEGLLAADHAELVAVWSRDPERNREAARAFEVEPAESIGSLLKLDLDAIYLATPPGLHREQAALCAQAGKHVFCEKPLAVTVTEAEAMVATCQAAGVQLGTAFMMRHQSQHLAARRMIEEGRLGRPVLARAQLSCWYPSIKDAWRQDPEQGGGGSLMDLGGHCIDLLEMFFGRVEAVQCMINNVVHGYAPEDAAVVTLRFENGATGMVDAFFCIPDESSLNVLELYGSKGSILAAGTIGQGDRGVMTAYLPGESSAYDSRQARPSARGLAIEPTPRNPYRAEIEEFSSAILEGRAPQNGAALGLQSQRVLAACYESARTGTLVRVEETGRGGATPGP